MYTITSLAHLYTCAFLESRYPATAGPIRLAPPALKGVWSPQGESPRSPAWRRSRPLSPEWPAAAPVFAVFGLARGSRLEVASLSHAFSGGGEGLVNCLYATCSSLQEFLQTNQIAGFSTSRMRRLRFFCLWPLCVQQIQDAASSARDQLYCTDPTRKWLRNLSEGKARS